LLCCGGRFEVDSKKERLSNIVQMEALEGYWEDTDNAAKIQKEKSILEETVFSVKKVEDLYEEFFILTDFATKDDDESSALEAFGVFDNFIKYYSELEKKALLSGEVDPNNAIVSINAGAGGTESCDWAQMLYRMVTRWAEHRKFSCQILDQQVGDSAGIKSVTFMVNGNFAYGLLKSESGIHRLVRISPFDANKRRHTSFASIFVVPELDDTIEIKIEDKDIKIDVFRAGGAGGQGVNTTDSAVRITHFPSGIVVTCQNERSQVQNKAQAMKVLKSRLYDRAMAEKRAKEKEIESEKKEIGWGSQIRSYVLHPYKLVKDHRTSYEVSTAEKVLDGDLDDFMAAYLQWMACGD